METMATMSSSKNMVSTVMVYNVCLIYCIISMLHCCDACNVFCQSVQFGGALCGGNVCMLVCVHTICGCPPPCSELVGLRVCL